MSETELTPGQMRINEMAAHLHEAESLFHQMQEHLGSAGTQFEASVNGNDRPPFQQEMRVGIQQDLDDLYLCANTLSRAFERPIVQKILRAYRCQEEGEPLVFEADFTS